MSSLHPYPLIYCPPGVARPACCPGVHQVGLLPGVGPDAVAHSDGTIQGGGGMCYGGAYSDTLYRWTKTMAGWYLGLNPAHKPQHLARTSTHPRIVRWVRVPGIHAAHEWAVPVLVTWIDESPVVAVDRIWAGAAAGWTHGDDLDPTLRACLAIANHIQLAPEPEDRNRQVRDLAVSLLALGHWLDEDLLVAAGWMSERMMISVIKAAIDQFEPAAA